MSSEAPSARRQASRPRGELFVLSAPSGAGKTTLIKALFADYPEVTDHLAFAVSHTTRAPRPGEVDGKDYYFVDRPRFETMVADDGFLEWAVVHDRLYGTSRHEVEGLLARGCDVLLDIDVQGAASLRRSLPEAPSIFIMPPSFGALEERLRGRGSESAEQIARRLGTSSSEVREYVHYDYVIVNEQLDGACRALASIFLARRCGSARLGQRVAEIVKDFPHEPLE